MDSQKNHGANNPVSKTLTLVVIVTVLFSTSCTTTRVITNRTIEPQSDTIQNELKKGDIVKITTKEGGNFNLKIIAISPEATEGFIVGYKYRGRGRRYRKSDQQQILFSEIAKIEKTEGNYNKTVSLIVVVLLIGGFLYGAAGASTYGG